MDRFNFFFRQKVTEGELDGAFDAVEAALMDWALDNGVVGITSGADVAENAGTPNLTVDVAGPASIYNQSGNRVTWTPTQDLNCAVDENSNPTAVVGAPNEKWLSIFAEYVRAQSDPRLDGDGATVYFVQSDSFKLNVVQGAEAVIPTATRPALRANQVLLADVRLIFGQTQILNADISTTRRQWAIKTVGSSTSVARGQVEQAVQDLADAIDAAGADLAAHIAAAANQHLASAVDYAGGAAWHDGTTNPAATVEAQLDKVITDLVADAGSDRIGAAETTVANRSLNLPAGSVQDQLRYLCLAASGLQKQATIRDVSLMRKRKEFATSGTTIYGLAFSNNENLVVSGAAVCMAVGRNPSGCVFMTWAEIISGTTDRTARLINAPDRLWDCVYVPAANRYVVVGRITALLGADIETNDDEIGWAWTSRTPTGMTAAGDEAVCICLDPDTGALIVGGANGKIIRSLDNGATWAAATTIPGGLGAYTWKYLAASPGGVIVALGEDGVNPAKVLTSSDGGDTWTDTSPVGLASTTARAVVYELAHDEFFFAEGGTSTTWRSTDGAGGTWVENTGPFINVRCSAADGSGMLVAFTTLGSFNVSDNQGVGWYQEFSWENTPDGNVHGASPWEEGWFPAADPQRAYFANGRFWLPDGEDIWISPTRGSGQARG